VAFVVLVGTWTLCYLYLLCALGFPREACTLFVEGAVLVLVLGHERGGNCLGLVSLSEICSRHYMMF